MNTLFYSGLLEVDATTVSSWIGSLGFPIVMAIGLLWYLFKVQKELEAKITELTVVMKQILEHIRKVDKIDDREDI